MSKPWLLAVADREDTLAMLERVRQAHLHDCELAVARSSDEAFGLFGSRHFDGVLISLAAGQLDGLGLCRRLSQVPDAQQTAIVLLVAPDCDESLREQGSAAEADAVIAQPASDAELAAILQLLGRLGQETVELNQRVAKRTAEAVAAHEQLQKEIAERQRAEQTLRETLMGLTQREKAEQKVRHHQTQLAYVARLSTMGEMGTAIAHELNQPLCAILTTAQASKRLLKAAGIQSGPVLDAIEQISAQAKRAGEMIHRLREFSRRRAVHRSTINMADVIRDAVQFVSVEARPQHVEFALDLPESVPPLLGDTIQIEQVLVNLMRNGIEAMEGTEETGRRLEIHLRILSNDALEVAVRDTGRGLATESMERLFDPFFSTKPEGMGIGLAVSRSIVEAHGGRLWAEASPDRGAIFRFVLPTGTGEKQANAHP
jgi:C4-dicarboxylate-specific signal transduction histidine kinase